MTTYDEAGLIPVELPEVVYVASAWWRDNDAFATIIATTKEVALSTLDLTIADELDRVADQDESDNPIEVVKAALEADLCTSGVFAEKLDTLNLSQTELHDLLADGYIWQE